MPCLTLASGASPLLFPLKDVVGGWLNRKPWSTLAGTDFPKPFRSGEGSYARLEAMLYECKSCPKGSSAFSGVSYFTQEAVFKSVLVVWGYENFPESELNEMQDSSTNVASFCFWGL